MAQTGNRERLQVNIDSFSTSPFLERALAEKRAFLKREFPGDSDDIFDNWRKMLAADTELLAYTIRLQVADEDAAKLGEVGHRRWFEFVYQEPERSRVLRRTA